MSGISLGWYRYLSNDYIASGCEFRRQQNIRDNVGMSDETCQNSFQMVTLSDRVATSSALNSVNAIGVVGLYVAFVLVFSGYVRGYFGDGSLRIPSQDLPDIRRIRLFCEAIYRCREMDELEAEEQLFSSLLRLYRSQQDLIAWTVDKEKQQ